MFKKINSWISRKFGNEKLRQDILDLEEMYQAEVVKNETLQNAFVVWQNKNLNDTAALYQVLTALTLREDQPIVISKDMLTIAAQTNGLDIIPNIETGTITLLIQENYQLEEENAIR